MRISGLTGRAQRGHKGILNSEEILGVVPMNCYEG
ncbi:hypothetical protein J3R03_002021 [Actinoplanes couchii]|nr:hypothetical protein [Actinoplanes couchii]